MKRGLIITIIVLFLLNISFSFILYRRYQYNKIINKEINNEQQEIYKKRKEKEDELERIKEENKDKMERYNKIEKWNEEIISYLE